MSYMSLNQEQLFTMALGLEKPWYVNRIEFDPDEGRIDLYLDFKRGSKFGCPGCGKETPVYDAEEHTWRHMNFFQYKAYLHARQPRTNCPDCGVLTVNVPWARPKSDFTLLFEALTLTLAHQMPVLAIAKLMGEHDTRLWRILKAHVDKTRAEADFSGVTDIGVDETSCRKGHHYITLFVDVKESKVLFATEGKDKETVSRFRQDLTQHQGDPDRIENFCSDLSPAFISGVTGHFPNADLTFDKFHIVKIVNEAVDEVRRCETKDNPWLKGTRYLWLKNPGNLSIKQRNKLDSLKDLHSKTSRAYAIKLSFQGLFEQPDINTAQVYLKKCYWWASHSRLEPVTKSAKTVKTHWNGILNWFNSRMNNGVLEGINSLIQAAKAKARGYRTINNLVTMCYIIAGKLDFSNTY
jgi:transposase